MSFTELYQDLVQEPGALLPIFHRIQERLGHIPPDALPQIAHDLNLSRAEVHGVMSFYHDFRSTPPGRCQIKVCRAEACQAMGAEALVAHIESRLDTPLHSTRADGAYTLEPTYCLGNCALSPALLIDGALQGRVTPARFDTLIAAVARSSAPASGQPAASANGAHPDAHSANGAHPDAQESRA